MDQCEQSAVRMAHGGAPASQVRRGLTAACRVRLPRVLLARHLVTTR